MNTSRGLSFCVASSNFAYLRANETDYKIFAYQTGLHRTNQLPEYWVTDCSIRVSVICSYNDKLKFIKYSAFYVQYFQASVVIIIKLLCYIDVWMILYQLQLNCSCISISGFNSYIINCAGEFLNFYCTDITSEAVVQQSNTNIVQQ